METTIRHDVYAETTKMDIHALVRELNENVGTAVVQGMVGVKDRTMPGEWAKPDGPTPRADTQQRLRLGHRVWRTVERSEGRDVALAFLMGSNPRLDDDLPLNAIYELKVKEVLGAAEAFN